VRDRHADLLEELLPGLRASRDTAVAQGVRRRSGKRAGRWRHIDRFAGRCNGADAAEREFDLAVKNGEHLLEVVTVGRRPAARRDVHGRSTCSAQRCRPRKQGWCRCRNHAEMRQASHRVGAHVRQGPPRVIGGTGPGGFGSAGEVSFIGAPLSWAKRTKSSACDQEPTEREPHRCQLRGTINSGMSEAPTQAGRDAGGCERDALQQIANASSPRHRSRSGATRESADGDDRRRGGRRDRNPLPLHYRRARPS